MEKYKAYVGLDWASRKHDVESFIVGGGGITTRGVIVHDGDKLREYFQTLTEKAGGKVAVCLEQSRGPVYNVLREVSGIDIYPVNPATLARFRRAFTPSGAKDDPTDATNAREIVQCHRQHLRSTPDLTEATIRLDNLTRLRRDTVDERTRLGLKLRDALKAYFPQALELFDDLTAPIASAFLKRWPEHSCALEESAEKLEAFFCSNHSTKKDKNAQRLMVLHKTTPFVKSRALIEPYIIQVQRLCRQIEVATESIKEFNDAIKSELPKHPDYKIFTSLPESGTIHAARLIAAFGDDRERFSSAEGVANALGISPILIRSGRSQVVASRVAKSRFVHQSVLEWAGATIKSCSWAREYYRGQRAKGKKHRVAQRALAYKWIRILFRCWKNRVPYSEALYKKNLDS